MGGLRGVLIVALICLLFMGCSASPDPAPPDNPAMAPTAAAPWEGGEPVPAGDTTAPATTTAETPADDTTQYYENAVSLPVAMYPSSQMTVVTPDHYLLFHIATADEVLAAMKQHPAQRRLPLKLPRAQKCYVL